MVTKSSSVMPSSPVTCIISRSWSCPRLTGVPASGDTSSSWDSMVTRITFPTKSREACSSPLPWRVRLRSTPSILVMDEPFSGLDAITAERMREELVRIWQETKKTVLFVTHDIGERPGPAPSPGSSVTPRGSSTRRSPHVAHGAKRGTLASRRPGSVLTS